MSESGIIVINSNRVLGGNSHLFFDGYIYIDDDGNVNVSFDVQNQPGKEDIIWAAAGITFKNCVNIELSGEVQKTNFWEMKGSLKGLPDIGVIAKMTILAGK